MSNDAFVGSPVDDYELIDFGGGRKLERFGAYIVDRPAPQATGQRALADWTADWFYDGHRIGEGEWMAKHKDLPLEWQVTIESQSLNCRLGAGGQTGIYPEHITSWRWIRKRLDGCYYIDDLRILNLFAGTGGATQAAVQAGASVTHVDAQKSQLDLARKNVGEKGARFICEDVMTFIERALRREDRYHMIILDPPSFGRGPKSRVWDINVDLQPLVRHLPRLVNEECRGIWFSLHKASLSADSLAQLVRDALPGYTVESLGLGVSTKDGRTLKAGVAAVWYDDTDLMLDADGRHLPFSAKQIEEKLDACLTAVLSSRRSASGPAASLTGLSYARQQFVLRWADIISRTNAELAFQFCACASQALTLMETSNVEAWIIRAMDTYDTTGLHPAIGVLQKVENFADETRKIAHGMSFDEKAGVLEIFVHGLNGRKLKLAINEQCYTDTETLFLPEMMTRLPESGDNFLLYKAMVVHLWAQCWFGTYRANISEHLQSYANQEKALGLLHTLERLRLDACIERALPGMHRQIRLLCGMLGEKPVPPGWETYAKQLAKSKVTVDDSLEILTNLYTENEVPAPLSYQGVLNPQAAEQIKQLRIEREQHMLQELLTNLADDASVRRDNDELDSPKGASSFTAKKTPDEDLPDGFKFELQLDGNPLKVPIDIENIMQSIQQDLGEIPESYLVAAGDGGYRMSSEHEDEDESSNVWKGTYHEKGAFHYNEWDFKRSHYRKNWCVLRETDVHPQSSVFVNKTLMKYSGLVKSIRSTFEALRGENKLLKKQQHGDDVDIDALVEAYADTLQGMEMTDRLFTKMHKHERNIAVMFMVDMSGSTKGWINDAERESLVLLCEALETLGDRYAIYGFSGMTRKRCELFRIKRFDEDYDDDVKSRIAGVKPQDYTRMGVIIRHLTSLLERVEARTKLLITLSDGKPDDYDGYRGEYGIEDTRMALIEAKRKCIHPFCITIDREAIDYLPHMYGAVNYTVIDDVRRLPLKVSDIYRRLTT